MYKIMIVEDDPAILDVLQRQLQKWGYIVYPITAFDTVLEQFLTCQPHLVLMDISLPFFNGYYWCAELRKRSRTPIVFISSAGDAMSLVRAIDLGADDFIAKPFNLDVITAKIQAVLRRTYAFGTELNVLEYGGVTLNLGDATLSYGDQQALLTKNEFKIMQILLENKGNVVSRDNIMRKLWESESFIDDNTLTVNVTRLRKKLDEIGLVDFITTQKGVGYLLEVRV